MIPIGEDIVALLKILAAGALAVLTWMVAMTIIVLREKRRRTKANGK